MSLSEIRVNTTKTRTGVGTITYTETGPVITGIATASNFKTGSTNVHSTGVELANINTGGSTATFGGPISGTTASFSGTVSIGGTLTYEDVTNIDSVGVVTARSGILVSNDIKSASDDFFVYSYKGGSDGQVRSGIQFDSTNQRMEFYTGTDEVVRIDSNGHVNLMTSTQNAYIGFKANSNAINFSLGSTAGAEPRIYLFGSGNGQSTAKDINILTGSGTGDIAMSASKTTITSSVNEEIFRIQTSYGNSGSNQGKALMGFDHFSVSDKPAILIGSEEEGNSSYKGAFVVKVKDAAATDDDPVERLRITSTGNILPGTNNATNIGDGSTNFHSIWASTRFRGNDNVKLILGNSQNLVIRHDGTNNIIGSPVADDLHIKSGTLDNDSQLIAAFKHSNGSVGITTDNPVANAKLDIWGDGSAYPTLRLGTEVYQTEGEDIRFGRTDHGASDIRYHSITSFHDASGGANYLKFKLHDGGSAPFQSQATVLTLLGNGRVGINEVSPDTPLHITGGLPHIRLENSGTSASANDIFGQIDFKHNDSDDAGVTASIKCVAQDNAGKSALVFGNKDGGDDQERLRIMSDGKIKFYQDPVVRTSANGGGVDTYGGSGLGEGGYIHHYTARDGNHYRRVFDIASVGDASWGSQIRFVTHDDGGATTTSERARITHDGTWLHHSKHETIPYQTRKNIIPYFWDRNTGATKFIFAFSVSVSTPKLYLLTARQQYMSGTIRFGFSQRTNWPSSGVGRMHNSMWRISNYGDGNDNEYSQMRENENVYQNAAGTYKVTIGEKSVDYIYQSHGGSAHPEFGDNAGKAQDYYSRWMWHFNTCPQSPVMQYHTCVCELDLNGGWNYDGTDDAATNFYVYVDD